MIRESVPVNVVCNSCKRVNCPCGNDCECKEFCRCKATDIDAVLKKDEIDFWKTKGIETDSGESKWKSKSSKRDDGSKSRFRVHMSLEGPHCSSCVVTVSRGLKSYLRESLVKMGGSVNDVEEVLVSLNNADFIVSIAKKNTDEEGGKGADERIKDLANGAAEAIEDTGFGADVLNIEDLNNAVSSNPYFDANKNHSREASKAIQEDIPKKSWRERSIVLELKPNKMQNESAARKKIEQVLWSITSSHGKMDKADKIENQAILHVTWEDQLSMSSNTTMSKKDGAKNNSPSQYVTIIYDSVFLATASSPQLQSTNDNNKNEIQTDTENEGDDSTEKSNIRGGIQFILQLIHETGLYQASIRPPPSKSQSSNSENKAAEHARSQRKQVVSKRRDFLLSLLGTIPVLIISMLFSKIDAFDSALKHSLHPSIPSLTVEVLLLWLLATPVQFYSGWIFYRGAYHGIRNRLLGMDVLVASGTTAAYGYAMYMVLSGIARDRNGSNMNHEMEEGMSMSAMGAHFFETSAVLISFVLLGQWLQLMATRRTSLALTKLLGLQSRTALLVTPIDVDLGFDDKKSNELHFDPFSHRFHTEEVPTSIVEKGDILQIIRGSAIPADGKIISGSLSVNESMITGESLPILKTSSGPASDDGSHTNSNVIGGTVAVEGTAYMSVTGIGKDSTLSQIVQLMEHAQMSRVPIQEFADRVASIFVPFVCTIAIISFIVWFVLCSLDVVPRR